MWSKTLVLSDFISVVVWSLFRDNYSVPAIRKAEEVNGVIPHHVARVGYSVK